MNFGSLVIVCFEQLNKQEVINLKKERLKEYHEKKDSVIEADSMITRLNDNMIILEGHVRGKFSENFNIL